MVKIKKQIVSNAIINNTSNGRGNPVNYIVIHETANTASGANAAMHAKLQSNGNSRAASWHYTCGSDGIYQSFPDNVKCWHAGSSYNDNSIGVEIAVNSDGNYKKAVKNAAALVKHLMKKHGVPKKNIITHKKASTWNKPCPSNMLNGSKGVTWTQFLKMIDGSSGKASTSKKKKKKKSGSNGKSITKMAKEVVAGKHGSGHASRRKSLGISKDKYEKVRKKVNEIASGGSSKSSSKSITKMAKEVINGKHGSGHSKRRKSLGISKKKYEKVRKKVNELASGNSSGSTKSVTKMAKEVINGKHGSGHAQRRKSLGISKKKYKKVRAKVNELASGGSGGSSKSIKQMAQEIINGKHGSGHNQRRKSLGISKAKYKKVRKKVNQML